MRLVDFDPSFLAFTPKPGVLRCHKDISKAHGLHFYCPKCAKEKKNDGKKPCQYILLFHSAPSLAKPEGRWAHEGTSFDDLTLLEPIKGECGFHAIISKGEIVSELV